MRQRCPGGEIAVDPDERGDGRGQHRRHRERGAEVAGAALGGAEEEEREPEHAGDQDALPEEVNQRQGQRRERR